MFLSHICTEFSLTIQNSIPEVTLGASTFRKLKVRFITRVISALLSFFTLIVSSINILSMF